MALSQKNKKAIDGYIGGKSKYDAMVDAGYSDSTARTKHSSVFGSEEAMAEISRRQKIAATRTDISLESLNKILLNIAEASLGDIITIGPGGELSLDYSKLTPELRKAINSFTIDEMQEGRGEGAQKFRRLKVGMSDRLRAIELLIRHNGLSKEKVVVEIEGDLVERLQRGRNRVAGEP